MNSIRLFTDEDVHGAIAAQLRNGGMDVLSTPEAGCLGQNDESQLIFAAERARVLLSFNVADFARLHYAWMRQQRTHAGLIVSQQRPVGEIIRRMLNLSQNLEAHEMTNRLEYLSNW